MSESEGREPEPTEAGNELERTDGRGLSDKQQLAIDLLIGTKKQDVAKAVASPVISFGDGVPRTHRSWPRSSPAARSATRA
jgi:hypothetical protein